MLSAPFWCLCQKLSLSLLYFNETLLLKALSNQASSLVPDWIPLLWRPRIPASFMAQQQPFRVTKESDKTQWLNNNSLVNRYFWVLYQLPPTIFLKSHFSIEGVCTTHAIFLPLSLSEGIFLYGYAQLLVFWVFSNVYIAYTMYLTCMKNTLKYFSCMEDELSIFNSKYHKQMNHA